MITDREIGQLIEKVNTLIVTTTETKSDIKELKKESKDHGERLASIEAKLKTQGGSGVSGTITTTTSEGNKTEVNIGNKDIKTRVSLTPVQKTAVGVGFTAGITALIVKALEWLGFS